jgi:hypothetical protein
MTRKTGTADLPLHAGFVSKWLANRMTRLGSPTRPPEPIG